jgi:hypothetical protein
MKDTVLNIKYRVMLLKLGYTESDMRALFLDIGVKYGRA